MAVHVFIGALISLIARKETLRIRYGCCRCFAAAAAALPLLRCRCCATTAVPWRASNARAKSSTKASWATLLRGRSSLWAAWRLRSPLHATLLVRSHALTCAGGASSCLPHACVRELESYTTAVARRRVTDAPLRHRREGTESSFCQ